MVVFAIMKPPVPEKKHVPCTVCGKNSFIVLYEPTVQIQDPVGLYGAAGGVRGTQRIVRCRHCGMMYENPRFDEETILQSYRSAQEEGHDSQYDMRVLSFFRTLNSLAPSLPPRGARVLDIGCAGGAFLEAAARFGFVAGGIEPCLQLADQGIRRGLNIMPGTLATAGLPPSSFDLICLWDVIEHLAEPSQALAILQKLIKPHGIVLINYPDIGTNMAKLAGSMFWWFLSSHLHYFSRKTMSLFLEKNGFRVLSFHRYWQTLKFGYLEDIAIHLKIPGGRFLKSLTPLFLKDSPVSYYASQTLCFARVA